MGSSGNVLSGSRGEGQGRKRGKRKDQDKDALRPLPRVLTARRRFSRLSILGMELDTFLHQLQSPTCQSFAPVDVKSPACPVCTCGCWVSMEKSWDRWEDDSAWTRCHQAAPVQGNWHPQPKRPRGWEVAPKRCPYSQLLRTQSYLLQAAHKEIALSPAMIPLIAQVGEETNCHLSGLPWEIKKGKLSNSAPTWLWVLSHMATKPQTAPPPTSVGSQGLYRTSHVLLCVRWPREPQNTDSPEKRCHTLKWERSLLIWHGSYHSMFKWDLRLFLNPSIFFPCDGDQQSWP